MKGVRSADLRIARAANDAAEKGKEAIANQYATQAAVDAELASARASAAQARKAEEEVSESTNTLRGEAERKSEAESDRLPDQR